MMGALGVLLALSHAAIAEYDETLPTDPRVVEANAVLSDEGARDRAVALYREALADDPDNETARRWLARLLSWDGRYDESLAEYDILLSQDPPPMWARRERADVLAWAGRYAEAEVAYQELLDEDPDDFDAASGLAHAYHWGRRPREAEEAYRRALAMREDEELRAGLEALMDQRVRSVALDARYFADSDDFEMVRAEGLGRYEFLIGTQLILRAGFTRIMGPSHVPGSLPESGRSIDNAFDGAIGLHQQFSQALSATLELGGRVWGRSPARFMLHADLEYTAGERTAVGLQLDHGDYLDVSKSVDAAEAGIYYTAPRLWLWQSLSEHVTLYTSYGVAFISDGNQQHSGSLSVTCAPWADREARFTLGGYLTGMTETSVLYYDPVLDASLQLEATGHHELNELFGLRYHASVGIGYSDQDEVAGFGPAFAVRAGPSLRVDGWTLAAEGYGTRSQRATSYTTWGGTLSLSRSF